MENKSIEDLIKEFEQASGNLANVDLSRLSLAVANIQAVQRTMAGGLILAAIEVLSSQMPKMADEFRAKIKTINDLDSKINDLMFLNGEEAR